MGTDRDELCGDGMDGDDFVQLSTVESKSGDAEGIVKWNIPRGRNTKHFGGPNPNPAN